MRTFYCVTSTYGDRGQVTANITATIQADVKPCNECGCDGRVDIYNDWFENLKDAEQFVREVKEA